MARVFQILSLLLALSLGVQLSAQQVRPPQGKADALSYLQAMRLQNVKRLKEIDETLRIRIEDSDPATLEFEVNRLKVAKLEHSMRQEFLNRLILQVDTKFSGGDLRIFLERSLNEMAKIDATQINAQAETGLWKFLKFASDAVRRLPERKENILVFLEGYMHRSVVNPIRPEDYLNTRNYSNGLASEAGRPLDRDEVGAAADSRLKGNKDEPALPAKSVTAPTNL
jgi:hypothetical protein